MLLGEPAPHASLGTHPAVLRVSKLLHEEAQGLALRLALAARRQLGAVALQNQESCCRLAHWRRHLGAELGP